MHHTVLGIALIVPLLAVVPAAAQQVAETASGNAHAGGQCPLSQIIIAATESGHASHPVDIRSEASPQTRAQLKALLDNALARSGTRPSRQSVQSLVIFPPSGS